MGGTTAKAAEAQGAAQPSDPAAPATEVPADGDAGTERPSPAPERIIAGRAVPVDVSGGRGPAMSGRMKAYFDRIRADVDACYAVAKEARAKGLDPSLEVEILPAEDLAARVEAQVGVPNVAEDIRKVSKEIGNRELVSLEIARRVAGGQYQQYSPTEAVDKAVRTGLSILTEGVLVAPLEGIAEVKIGSNDDGTKYVDLYFAGPIRAAGGTAQAMSVLIADVVRRELGIDHYKVTDAELERYKEEVPAYKQAANLQYTPGPQEIEAIVKNCPVCINGEGTERVEITGNRDLPRVETNQIRGGAMLVLCEGMCLKAPKLQKHVAKLGLEGWGFLDLLVSKKEDEKDDDQVVDPDALPEIPPSTKYIRDIIAGRPVFGYPKRAGGFRLRYGRSRTAGLASSAVHPAVMSLVDDFIAIGTQLKIERPGKGTIGTPCSTIDPPSVELRTGDIVRLDTVKEVAGAKPFLHAILDLGELLMPFGEFSENNHILPRSPWVNEWFEVEVAAYCEGNDWPDGLPKVAALMRRDRMGTLDAHDAYRVAEATGLPLAPSQSLFWHDVAPAEIKRLSDHLAAHLDDPVWAPAAPARPVEAGHPDPIPQGKTLFIPADEEIKEILRKLVLHHRDLGDRYEVTRHAYTFVRSLGFEVTDDRVTATARRGLLDALPEDLDEQDPSVDLVSRLSGVQQVPRGPFRIGARMGRPEKADARKMKPPPHVLFPLGTAGGTQRLVGEAATVGKIKVEVGKRRCTQCAEFTYRTFCDVCRGHTVEASEEPEEVDLDLRDELKRAQEALNERRLPKQIKGVVGMMSAHKTPEPLEKGILRAKHGVYTFKDGTVRFDMTDGPLTHFRPNEVAVPVDRLKELGYTHDRDGRPLERDDQMVELFVQDLVVPNACGDYLLACAKYVDDLMVKFYGMEPFYKAETRDDLVGHMLGGLAPHTSGAIASRIVGFTPSQVGWGHPYFHAGKRRNCVTGDTEVIALNSPEPARRSLMSIWDDVDALPERVDDQGAEAKPLDGLRVHTVDPSTGETRLQRAVKIYRVPAPDHLLKIKTRSGRSIICSPGHRLLIPDGDGVAKRRALELEVGNDLLLLGRPAGLHVVPEDLDLLKEWWDSPPDGLMVRGSSTWFADLINRHGGLEPASRIAGVSNKALDNFRRRDSIPIGIVKSLCGTEGIAALPGDISLGVARDTVTVPRIVPMGPHFLRIVGYYLAEGCARADPGSLYQVDIASSESEMTEDILHCAEVALGIRPRPGATRVTFSGRLLHLLFTSVLGLGSDSHSKSIPPRLAALPKDLMRHVLAAYFAGDGSVEKGRLHVICDSVSDGLIRDLGYQLSRWGIACRIRRQTRQGGGAVSAFYAKKGLAAPRFSSTRLSIRSSHAVTFGKEIGFALPRKQRALDAAIPKMSTSRISPGPGDSIRDEIQAIENVPSTSEWLYDLEVENDHNYMLADLLLSSNCDGDEDAVFLLMDGLLNFSKSYVPDRRGGLMDLPLVLTTRLDPAEIDKEAHNVDTLDHYPLAFYRATRKHVHPKEMEEVMGMVAERVGTPAQYEGFGYTHDTPDISEGVLMSAYKIIPDMMAKLVAQLDLASRIRAVDMKDVASRVIGSHFMPDLIGNLKAFSKQKVRCPACNAKYRRFPLKGSCLTPNCKGKLTLTVHEGSVRKYLQPAKDISRKYSISHYTYQRILLAEKSIESLFNNDKVKKAKLTDFLVPDDPDK